MHTRSWTLLLLGWISPQGFFIPKMHAMECRESFRSDITPMTSAMAAESHIISVLQLLYPPFENWRRRPLVKDVERASLHARLRTAAQNSPLVRRELRFVAEAFGQLAYDHAFNSITNPLQRQRIKPRASAVQKDSLKRYLYLLSRQNDAYAIAEAHEALEHDLHYLREANKHPAQ